MAKRHMAIFGEKNRKTAGMHQDWIEFIQAGIKGDIFGIIIRRRNLEGGHRSYLDDFFAGNQILDVNIFLMSFKSPLGGRPGGCLLNQGINGISFDVMPAQR